MPITNSIFGAASGDNLYTADGTLTGSRTVTMAGNSVLFDGAGDVVIADDGQVKAAGFEWSDNQVVANTASPTITPLVNRANTVVIANTVSGTITIANADPGTNQLASYVKIGFVNSGAPLQTIALGNQYYGRDGTTALGTISVATTRVRQLEFQYRSDNWGGGATTKWVLVSDTDGEVAGSLQVTPLNASLALPAATGSGAAFIYEVGSAAPINLTAPGGTVGGVATFVASNHGAGAKLLVSDSAANAWDVSEVGAPASRTLARYSVSGVAAGVSLVNGANILPIGALVTSNLISSGLSVAGEHDPLAWRSANQITVSKAGRYRVDLNAVHSTDNLSGASDQDAVGVSRAGIRINGTAIEWIGMDDTAGLADQMSGFVIRSFAVGDEIDVVVNATSAAAGEDFYVSFAMEELPSTESVQAGTVVPTPLAFSHARALVAQAVADSTNVIVALDSAISDSSGLFVSGTNRIVAAVAGLYRIRGVVPWSTSGNPGIQSATILVNGVAVKSSSTRNNQPMSVVEVETTLQLAAGDYVQLRARHETGGAMSTSVATTNLANVFPELEVRQLPGHNIVAYTPGDVVVENLDHLFLYEGNNLSFIQTVPAVAVQAGPDTLAAAGSRLDLSTPSSSNLLGITASGTIATIAKAGRYAVDASINCYYNIGGTTRYWWQLVKNGSAVLATSTVSDNSASVTNSHNIVWAGTLAATDTLDLRVGVQSVGDVNVQNYSLRVEQMPVGMLVDPGTVPVEDLDYVSYATSNIGGSIPTEIVGGRYLPQLDAANWTHKVDTNSLLTLAAPPVGDSFTIKKAGMYAVSVNMVANSYAEQTVYIFRSGTIVASGWANTGAGTSAMSQVGADITLPLAVGDRIQFGSLIAAGWSASLSIRQLPSSSVVNSGTVPITPLSLASFSGSRGSNGVLVPATVHTNEGGALNAGTGLFTAPRSGRYRVAAFLHNTGSDVTQNVAFNLVKNGAAFMTKASGAMNNAQGNNILAFDRAITLAAGDTLLADITYAGVTYTNHFDITYQEMPTATVIDPGTVPVNDQTASGYFDIGTMRMQWGVTPPSSSGTAVITFPAAFANSNYRLTASTTSQPFFLQIGTKGTTSLTLTIANTSGGGATGVTAEWIAIGVKP